MFRRKGVKVRLKGSNGDTGRATLIRVLGDKHWSVRRAASEARVSFQTVSQLTTPGKSRRDTCSYDTARKLCGALGLQLGDVFDLTVITMPSPSHVAGASDNEDRVGVA